MQFLIWIFISLLNTEFNDAGVRNEESYQGKLNTDLITVVYQSNKIQSLNARSKCMCLAECSKDSACFLMTYDVVKRTCTLFEKIDTSTNTLITPNVNLYIKKGK